MTKVFICELSIKYKNTPDARRGDKKVRNVYTYDENFFVERNKADGVFLYFVSTRALMPELKFSLPNQ